MQRGDHETYVFKEKSWEPIVRFVDGAIIYDMPVACGHFDKFFQFEITASDFAVLKADPERRYFLYAVLHSIYQSRPQVSAVLQDAHFAQVLHGERGAVEKLLNLRDKESNRAVSNLVRIYLERDQQAMIAGCWFQDARDA